jgi:hypothetical protein
MAIQVVSTQDVVFIGWRSQSLSERDNVFDEVFVLGRDR